MPFNIFCLFLEDEATRGAILQVVGKLLIELRRICRLIQQDEGSFLCKFWGVDIITVLKFVQLGLNVAQGDDILPRRVYHNHRDCGSDGFRVGYNVLFTKSQGPRSSVFGQ